MKDRDKEAILKKAKEILQKQLRFKIDYCLQNGGDAFSVRASCTAFKADCTGDNFCPICGTRLIEKNEH